MNKVILIGNVGQDPEVRNIGTGETVASVSVATSERWKDKQTGERKEKTEWHRIVVWGKLAEIVRDYVQKGSKVAITGKLQTRKWQDNSGADRYTTEIVATEIEFVGARQDGEGGQSSGGGGRRGGGQAPPATELDDEIPF